MDITGLLETERNNYKKFKKTEKKEEILYLNGDWQIVFMYSLKILKKMDLFLQMLPLLFLETYEFLQDKQIILSSLE
jgi:hypothetical protein